MGNFVIGLAKSIGMVQIVLMSVTAKTTEYVTQLMVIKKFRI